MSDTIVRERALDPNNSFIIQAPAGSGKTELLTQRFLTLLGLCQEPEEILAVTFTRKAAGEMKHRLVHALQNVQNGYNPTTPHAKKTHDLAKKAVLQNEKLGWDLDKNPSRLKIITIDSLASSLTKNLPLLSAFGAEPSISEDASPLYRQAIEQLLPRLEIEEDALGEHLKSLLHHLDNRVDVLVRLCTTLLSKREQWLPYIMYAKSEEQIKSILEHALEHVVSETINSLENTFELYLPELVELALYAARNIDADTLSDASSSASSPKIDPIVYCLGGYPDEGDSTKEGDDSEEGCRSNGGGSGRKNEIAAKRDYWLGILSLLLTQTGDFRKTVTKNQGFYAKSHFKSKEDQAVANIMKDNMVEMLKTLSAEPGFAAELFEVLLLPPLSFEASQWKILDAIIELMPVLCANLKVVFQSEGQIDFVELAMAATTALGTPDAPSELVMALDYQIKHILIDEFQDTSEIQYDLFSKLIQEWQPGEGRSLFLVGDPMQSVYRFRGAEVGVFLRAKQYGLAQIPLEYLSLYLNFRSSPIIVSWVNDCGQELFPAKEEIAKGAIAYLSSEATREDLSGQIHCWGFEESDKKVIFSKNDALEKNDTFNKNASSNESELQDESRANIAMDVRTVMVDSIVEEIKSLIKDNATTVAVLVRYRQHAYPILQKLKAANIPFEAIDMYPMVNQAYIQDLIVLIRAMTNLSDKIAWVALLRTPFMGFTLDDVHRLAGYPFDELVYQRLERSASNPQIDLSGLSLSEPGQITCQRVFPILKRWVEQRGRLSIADWVKGLWFALGGPCFLKAELDSADLNLFFDIVTEFESQNKPFTELETYLERQYVQSDLKIKAQVQIMTIHKAKGLEFDHVFIPSLEARPRSEDHQLFLWMHQSHGSHAELFMAPIRSSVSGPDKVYRYVEQKLKQKLEYESSRLLYVAMTRAKKNLYLCSVVSKADEKSDLPFANPVKGSFLKMIETAFRKNYRIMSTFQLSGALSNNVNIASSSNEKGVVFKRFKSSWTLPDVLSGYLDINNPLKDDNVQGELPPLWHAKEQTLSPDTLRHIGTLVHQLFYRAVNVGLSAFKSSWTNIPIELMLKSLGVPLSELRGAVLQVNLAIQNTLECPKGQWILDSHDESKAEWPLWVLKPIGYQKMVLDRAFISQGAQWIIDYKVIHNINPSPEDWAGVVELYKPQLQSYASALRGMGRGKSRTGLYFPIQAHWIEVS